MSDGAPASAATSERLDETRRYSTDELCVLCRIDETTIVRLIEHGVIEHHDGSSWSWRSVHRITRAVRVQREFEIDLTAVPLVLDLLERIERQQRELQLLRGD